MVAAQAMELTDTAQEASVPPHKTTRPSEQIQPVAEVVQDVNAWTLSKHQRKKARRHQKKGNRQRGSAA